MSKRVRKRLIILGVIIVVIAAIIAYHLGGWRLFGFNTCTSFEYIDMEATMLNENNLGILVSCRSNGLKMQGYVYKIDDSTLKIGFKFSIFANGGMMEQFILPLEKPIDKIIMCAGKEQTEIPIHYPDEGISS